MLLIQAKKESLNPRNHRLLRFAKSLTRLQQAQHQPRLQLTKRLRVIEQKNLKRQRRTKRNRSSRLMKNRRSYHRNFALTQSKRKFIVNRQNSFRSPFDVSRILDEKLSDEQKYDLIKNVYVPSEAEMKRYGVSQNGQNRYAQPGWLARGKPYLAFSVVRQGLLCVPCASFAPQAVGNGMHQSTGHFTSIAFRRYKDFSESWESHISTKFHAFCIEMFESFMRTSGPDSRRAPNVIELGNQAAILIKSTRKLKNYAI